MVVIHLVRTQYFPKNSQFLPPDTHMHKKLHQQWMILGTIHLVHTQNFRKTNISDHWYAHARVRVKG